MRPRIICVGEILWDIIGDQKHIGGAPFNTAAHLAALGLEAAVVSGLGRDEPGELAAAELLRLGVDGSMVSRFDSPTGYALVFSKPDGTPDFELPEGMAYDRVRIDASLRRRIVGLSPAAVVYGSLALKRNPGLRADLSALMAELEDTAGLFDVNLRKDFFDGELLREGISLCRILKFNDGELPVISSEVYGTELSFEDFARRVFSDSGCCAVVETRGGGGAIAADRMGNFALAEGIRVELADTVGAGDAFNAGFLCRFIRKSPLKVCLDAGNRMGAYVASKKGAVPPLDKAIVKAVTE